jgi:type IV secretory pathway protease TraF
VVRARPPPIVVGTQAMRTRPIAGMGIALALLMMPASPDPTVYVVWNASPSVAIGLYGVVHRRPNFGELALVRLPEAIAQLADQRGYLSRSALLIKPVAATVGDRVCRFGADVFVRGHLVAHTATVDEPPPAWHGCRTLKGGELFLLTDHPASFDSRYFGPLHAKHVIGTAVPIW